jgi:hypothetical protein
MRIASKQHPPVVGYPLINTGPIVGEHASGERPLLACEECDLDFINAAKLVA